MLNWISILSLVLRASKNIYLNKKTLPSTIFKLIPVREGFKKNEKVKVELLAEVRG